MDIVSLSKLFAALREQGVMHDPKSAFLVHQRSIEPRTEVLRILLDQFNKALDLDPFRYGTCDPEQKHAAYLRIPAEALRELTAKLEIRLEVAKLLVLGRSS